MAKKKKSNLNNKRVKRFKILGYLKTHWIECIGSIGLVIISVVLTKACDRIIPNQPLVVEKVPDTIQVVYVYDSLFNSAASTYLQQSEEPIKTNLKKQSRGGSSSAVSYTGKVNTLFQIAKFPNAEGYTASSSAPYFSLEMSSLDNSYVDFSFSFFNEQILDEVYCLSLKVFSINNGGRVYILDENYEKQKGRNIIRLKNIFTSGQYEVEVGFFLKKDVNAKYPTFYREAMHINNQK